MEFRPAPLFLFIVFSLFYKSSEIPTNYTIEEVHRLIFHDSAFLNGIDANNFSVSAHQFDLWLQALHRKDSSQFGNVLKNCSAEDALANNKECYLKPHKCLNGPDLLALKNASTLTSDVLRDICPFMLYQVHSDVCSKVSDKQITTGRNKPTTKEIWGYGILFVTIISLCSVFGIIILPVIGQQFYKKLLTYLVGLAVGSLASSAIFHLIPQTFGLLDNGSHDYLWKALVIITSIYVFFMAERFMKLFTDNRQRKKKLKELKDKNSCDYVVDSSQINLPVNNIKTPTEYNRDDLKSPDHLLEAHTLCHHDHEVMFDSEKDSNPIATVAYMIIFGDGLHNFIDGLSIGAAFSENIMAGISISVAILCEEFPHELGDFAVLLNAGMTIKQAVLYNFMSACTCYFGLIVGILLGELEQASVYIFAIAAGMFLYIALVDMVPEINATAEEASKKGVKEGLKVLFLQSVGIITGVLALFILALYSDRINFD